MVAEVLEIGSLFKEQAPYVPSRYWDIFCLIMLLFVRYIRLCPELIKMNHHRAIGHLKGQHRQAILRYGGLILLRSRKGMWCGFETRKVRKEVGKINEKKKLKLEKNGKRTKKKSKTWKSYLSTYPMKYSHPILINNMITRPLVLPKKAENKTRSWMNREVLIMIRKLFHSGLCIFKTITYCISPFHISIRCSGGLCTGGETNFASAI